MTRLLPILVLILGNMGIIPAISDAQPSQRPNIVLITADDLGIQLSCYGDKRINTPHLDGLAQGGVRFNHAYVAQGSCSSSRSALLTGLYPHQNGQYGLAHLGFSMHPGQKTLPALLKSAGYFTGIIGKLHVEPAAEFPFDWMPKKEKVAAGPTRNVQWVSQMSREFLGAAAKAGQPFFYYVNYFDPHGPYTPDTRQVAGLPEKPVEPGSVEPMPFGSPTEVARDRVTSLFLDCVLRLDVGVGLLLEDLRKAGVADNTLVIFMGDNGAPVRRGKTTCYEAGVQVPLIVAWAGKLKAGQARDELVSSVDIMPTVLAAAGVEIPDGLAGMPLQPLLRGASGQEASWREYLFTEMNFHTANHYDPQRTVRDQRHKLVLNLIKSEDRPAVELFDLKSDPGENKNLAEDTSAAEVRGRLEKVLEEWRVKSGDPLLDETRRGRWMEAAKKWKSSAPRLEGGDYPDVAKVPPGEQDLLK